MSVPNTHAAAGRGPFRDAMDEPEVPLDGVPVSRRRSLLETPAAAEKTVLCIDDIEAVLEVTEAFLRNFGFNVLCAVGGRQGLALALNASVDAVVLDYDMPDLDGPQVAALIKQKKPGLPIILYSGHPREMVESTCSLVDGFVRKGGSPAALVSEVKRVLGPPAVSTRRFRRFNVDVRFWITIQRPHQQVMRRGTVRDLGPGGLGGLIQGELAPGDLVRVYLQLPHSRAALESAAIVRHRTQDRCGLEFLDLNPKQEDELQRCCRKLQAA